VKEFFVLGSKKEKRKGNREETSSLAAVRCQYQIYKGLTTTGLF
jgi:hypothetical protein